jgi:hypothetical protein
LEAVANLAANRENAEVQSWVIVQTRALTWQKARLEGMWEKSLWNDPIRRRATRLIKLNPGAEIPAHRHLGDEETFVLEGTGRLGDSAFGPGDYHLACSGSLHPAYKTAEGCVFLLFSGTEYEFPAGPIDSSNPDQFKTVHSDSRRWRNVRAGFHTQTFFSTPALPGATTLLRLDAESAVDTSEFGLFEAYVLEGDARLGTTEIFAGDYLRKNAAVQMGQFRSQLGCTLLIRAVS